MNCAALVYSMRGDSWAALAGSIDAFFAARNENDRLGMATAMPMLAGSLLLLTPVESEIGMLRVALKIADEAAHGPLQQRAHNLRGIVLGDIGRFDEAAMHFGAAYQYAIVVPSQFGNWRVLANMANLSRKLALVARARHATLESEQRFTAGIKTSERVESHCREQQRLLILVDALSISGLLLTQHGHHQEAHKELNEAWNLACEHKLRATLPLL